MLDSITAQLFLAVALGLDAFSVCLGIGLQPLRLKKIFIIGLWIGTFHIFMPLLGLWVGTFLVDWAANFTELISGLLLFGLGIHMIIYTFAEDYGHQRRLIVDGTALIMLAFSVSLDSFPVGISLGMSGIATMLTLLLFGMVTTVMVWTSLIIGKKIQSNYGRSFEWLGGFILCLLGLYVIF